MTNFDAIQKNIASYLGPASSQNEAKAKKLPVETLTIRGAKAEGGATFMNGKTMRVPPPDITLMNLGKAKGGITAGELCQEIARALTAKLSSPVSFDRLLSKSTGQGLNKAGPAFKGLFK